jgi:UPF0755 protein
MADELDLAFDEYAAGGDPRRTADPVRKRPGRSKIAFLMAFVLLGVLGVGVVAGYHQVLGLFAAPDYDGPGTAPVRITLAQDATLNDIGNALVDAGVVESTKAFVRAAAADPRGRNIGPGTYDLKSRMSAKDAVALLLDPASRVTTAVTIPEGSTAAQTFELLSRATKIPVRDFRTAATDPVALGVDPSWFTRRDGRTVRTSVEGFLFPGAYQLDPSMTAGEILRTMVARFVAAVTDAGFAGQAQNLLSVSPFEALTVASIAQAESGTAADLPKIARVAYNRAYKAHLPLDLDATADYWTNRDNGTAPAVARRLTGAAKHDPENPYDTASTQGLPPGPIDSPGAAALRAAARPAIGPWLYFVVIDKAGTTAFATTAAAHAANVRQACANGLPVCP